jgi:hypothetical protein
MLRQAHVKIFKFKNRVTVKWGSVQHALLPQVRSQTG